MADCFNEVIDNDKNINTYKKLNKYQKASLDMKIAYSVAKIREFYEYNDGMVSVSFSGGKDSTVLLHLVRSIYPDIPGVFFDTGLEYPEIREHVKSFDNIIWTKPKMNFRKVITTYGYPVIGKNVAMWVSLAQRGYAGGIKQCQLDTKFGCKKYAYLVDAPFKVSEKCCNVLKKNPSKEIYKETGRCPIIGVRAEESAVRADAWVKYGDNHYNTPIPSCNPLSIWRKEDIDEYIKRNDIKLAKVYYMGYDRTGCIFCMFGAHLEPSPNKFEKLKVTHPELWDYCMRPIDDGGLGLQEVCDYIGIPTGKDQTNLIEWAKIKH